MPTETEKSFPLFDTFFENVEFPCLGYTDFKPDEIKYITITDRVFGIVLGLPDDHKLVSVSSMRNNMAICTEYSVRTPTPLHKHTQNPDSLRPLSDRHFLGAFLATILEDMSVLECVFEDNINDVATLVDDEKAEEDIPAFLRAYRRLGNKDKALDNLEELFKSNKLPIRMRLVWSKGPTQPVQNGWCYNSPLAVCLEFGIFDEHNNVVVENRFYVDPFAIGGKGYKKLNRYVMLMIADNPTQHEKNPNIISDHIQSMYRPAQL